MYFWLKSYNSIYWLKVCDSGSKGLNSALLFSNLSPAATKSVESVEQFFVRLQKKYNWTDQGKKKAVLEDLRKKEINTVKVLKELWEDVKSELPLSTGMRIVLEEEMKHI